MKIQQKRRYLESHRLESMQKLVTEIDNNHIYHCEFSDAVIYRKSLAVSSKWNPNGDGLNDFIYNKIGLSIEKAWAQCRGDGPHQLVTRFGVLQRV